MNTHIFDYDTSNVVANKEDSPFLKSIRIQVPIES